MNSVCTLCCDGCKEHGERVERERIIKLLEAHPIVADNDGFTYCDHADCDTDVPWKSHVIALIKGEK